MLMNPYIPLYLSGQWVVFFIRSYNLLFSFRN
jgi:hypothetical protein